MDEELLRGQDWVSPQRGLGETPRRGRGRNQRASTGYRLKSSERLKAVIERQRKSHDPQTSKSSRSEAPLYYGDDESEGLLDQNRRDEQGERFF